EKQTAFALKGTNVFAVLSLPIDKRKAAAVIEGAVADAIARRPAGSGSGKTSVYASAASSSITVEPASAGADFGGPSSSDSNKKPMMMIGIGIAAVVVASAGFWFFMRSPASSTAPTAADGKKASVSISADAANTDDNVVAEKAPVVDMPLVNGTVDELLEKARLAMRERRYTEPNGDNALLYYRSAVKADPSNGEAGDG